MAAPPPLDRHNKDLSSTIAKGKRTKRYRHHSPIPFAATPLIDQNNNINNNNNCQGDTSSPVIASSEESTTTEDVDVARCLILLAQGRFNNNDNKKRQIEDNGTTNNNNNNNAYTCKTCGRSFPSFQALGGHRTSHKKFKIEKKQPIFFSDEEDFPSPSSKKKKSSNSSLSLQLNSMIPPFSPSPSPRVHQCSYCGAEFTSGQALGGHMRKHRSVPPVNNRSRNVSIIEEECRKIARDDDDDDNAVLCLDLNLPAPAEDHEGGIVAIRQQELIGDVRDDESNEATALVLANTNTATTPLVDCHY